MPQAVNWKDLAWDQVIEGMERKVVHGDNMTLVLVRLAPGLDLPVHTHPHEQYSYILSGHGVFEVDGKDVQAVEGDTLHFPGELPHGLKVGGEGILALDVFTPVRDEFPASSRS